MRVGCRQSTPFPLCSIPLSPPPSPLHSHSRNVPAFLSNSVAVLYTSSASHQAAVDEAFAAVAAAMAKLRNAVPGQSECAFAMRDLAARVARATEEGAATVRSSTAAAAATDNVTTLLRVLVSRCLAIHEAANTSAAALGTGGGPVWWWFCTLFAFVCVRKIYLWCLP